MEFDFSREPGKSLKQVEYEIGSNKDEQINKDKEAQTNDNKNLINIEPKISVIMPFYNDKDYIEQSVRSVLNQTFPCFELLIIDDGSKDEKSLKKLEELEKWDERIKVYHKENEGLAATRDYGASKASESSKYFFFLDSDDLIEDTYLECGYWTLETNKEASWAYTDVIGFDAQEYTWNRWFNSEKLKKENDLVAAAMIRKKDFFEVNGYELREKAVHEDWNFWLKLIAKGKYPVRMNFYGSWYRRKATNGELIKARENKKRAMEIINETASTVTKEVQGVQYPKFSYNWEQIVENAFEIFEESDDNVSTKNSSYEKGSINIANIKKKTNNKTNILMIIPWMIMGGADRFNLSLVAGLDKDKFDITVISMEPAVNTYRQKFEEYGTVYDLTTFLDQKYWIAFINYIIEKNNINLILNTNCETGYSMLPYLKAKNPEIPIADYVHMEEWYFRNGGYSRDSSSVSSVIDKTLTCNENSRQVLINHFGRKADDVKTVYIGVDENKFNPELYNKEEVRKEFGIDKRYVIGYICRITEQKRPFLLLEIAKKLKENRDDFCILVVGTGNLYSKVKDKASKLGLDGNIKFVGNIENAEKVYSACDVTINCSIKEGLALTSYESLAMGVPVISSDVGGQKELINEDVGVVVPCLQREENVREFSYSSEEIDNYVEAINKVLENIEQYKKNCRKRILEGFTISNMINNMSEILENIAKNPNEDKIKNGINLSQNIDITKELITKNFVLSEVKYEWEVTVYNKEYRYNGNYRLELFGEKMWEHKWYRSMIGILKRVKGDRK